jgi:Cysteine-rich secretory protein family
MRKAFQEKGVPGRWSSLFVTFGVALAMQLAPTQLHANNLPDGERASETETLQQRWLTAHNIERARMGVAPLRWDDRLTQQAQKWANHLASTQTFDHAPNDPADDQGENLWMGTKRAYSAEEMVAAWVDEKRWFKPYLFPNVSRTGNWKDVGHYVQVIWHNTTRVGCAVAEGGGDEYLVCRYDPPGNWEGEFPLGDSAPNQTVMRSSGVNK